MTRASYQDPNPLNVSRVENKTVLRSELTPQRVLSTRDTNTWKSNIFYNEDGDDAKKRFTNTFKSTVFACATQNPVNRKVLGGESKGTETLFGQDETFYATSSQNELITRPQSAKLDYK